MTLILEKRKRQSLRTWVSIASVFFVIAVHSISNATESSAAVKDALAKFDSPVKALMTKHCYACHGNGKHKGNVVLDDPMSLTTLLNKTPMWLAVQEQIMLGNMPPEDGPKPPKSELESIAKWAGEAVAAADAVRPKDPGFIALHRLNKTEYNNTIQELCGVDFRPADDFPNDDSGYGFDNIADVLTMSPLLAEKYIGAAEQVVEKVLKKEAIGLTPVAAESGAGPGKENKDPKGKKGEPGKAAPPVPPPAAKPAPKPAVAAAGAPLIAPGEGGRKVFIVLPSKDMPENTCAETILKQFITRAFRRPYKDLEFQGLMKIYNQGRKDNLSFEKGVGLALTAALVSPHFLFRVESMPGPSLASPDNPTGAWPLTQFEIATRLSYFLWSSMPDDELFNLAAQRKLSSAKVREEQVSRMMKDPRSNQLIENFAGQWLELRNLDDLSRDPKMFPNFNLKLAESMYREAIMFFDSVAREDQSILTLIDADYTFVNGALAEIYGIKNVTGAEFKRVPVAGTPRGGVITLASTMALTANPARTSPVKRGKWVLENLLGTPPPPPPPEVPTLAEKSSDDAGSSLRVRLEKHRADATCAVCHIRMDGMGFALENFDSIGRWRDTDGKFPIDNTGELPGGEKVKGPVELKKIVLKKQDAFVKTFIEKMMVYSLGRGVKLYDRAVVLDTLKYVHENGNKFSAVINGIVNSDAFTKRREKRGDE